MGGARDSRAHHSRGTEGSNPAPSSGESSANLTSSCAVPRIEFGRADQPRRSAPPRKFDEAWPDNDVDRRPEISGGAFVAVRLQQALAIEGSRRIFSLI